MFTNPSRSIGTMFDVCNDLFQFRDVAIHTVSDSFSCKHETLSDIM